MQRVSNLLPTWDWNRSSVSSLSSNHTHKNSTDRTRGWTDKIPSTRSSRQAREAFSPATLDKECEKAARILKSFCSDGLSTPEERPGSPLTSSSSQSSDKPLKKIPPKLIQNAVGMAIFTSMRSGLWTSGPGGSGILIARKTDGSWSPPSGLMLQSPSLGFVIGVDIYDCILLINNFTVLEAFARPKLTLGTDVMLAAGPMVSLGLLENDVTWTDLSDAATAYVKASGQFAEIKLDGTILQERNDENERFYGMSLGVAKILSGDINQSLPQLRPLTEVLKAAEGRVDYDTALVESLSSQPIPGDTPVESSATPSTPPVFGLPAADDPDPFGVLALEMAGVGIREAGSHTRPESSHFEYRPSPASPVCPKVKRRSIDTIISYSIRSNRSNRGSYMSSKTGVTEKSLATDSCVQTFSTTPATTPTHSQSQSEDGHQQHSADEVHEPKESAEMDYTMIDISSLRKLSNFPDLEEPIKMPSNSNAPVSPSVEEKTETASKDWKMEIEGARRPLSSVDEDEGDADDEDDENSSVYGEEDGDEEEEDEGEEDEEGEDEVEDEEDDRDFDSDDGLDEEEAVVIEVATAQAPTRVAMVRTQVMQAKGAVVNIPKRAPPPLPTRSAARNSRRRSQMLDVGNMVGSPLKKEFDPSEISDVATTDAPKPQEPTISAVHDEAFQAPDNAISTEVSEDPIDAHVTSVAFVHEAPTKRASSIMYTASEEEQVNLAPSHKSTAVTA
ncbi:hypothetical protein GGR50DRAFT_688569 [Xylaria sp. CBS 124048]|nr:hypothetical protein GGR50DRAFT_688569 [Xylaria sp. CBS 124048]